MCETKRKTERRMPLHHMITLHFVIKELKVYDWTTHIGCFVKNINKNGPYILMKILIILGSV